MMTAPERTVMMLPTTRSLRTISWRRSCVHFRRSRPRCRRTASQHLWLAMGGWVRDHICGEYAVHRSRSHAAKALSPSSRALRPVTPPNARLHRCRSLRFKGCMGRRHLRMLLMTATCGAAVVAISVVGIARTPSISGRAVDGIGQPLPGVSVTTTAEAGGIARTTVTGHDGTYRFEALADGLWRVDFEIAGFDMIRRNHVRVRAGTTAYADASLPISALCECVDVVPQTPLRERAGLVVDGSGRPLAHARIQIVSPVRRDEAYADAEGRFRVRVPVGQAWPLTASDSGFGVVTRQVSADLDDPIVFRLRRAGTTGVPETERLNRGCRCPGDLFTHPGR